MFAWLWRAGGQRPNGIGAPTRLATRRTRDSASRPMRAAITSAMVNPQPNLKPSPTVSEKGVKTGSGTSPGSSRWGCGADSASAGLLGSAGCGASVASARAGCCSRSLDSSVPEVVTLHGERPPRARPNEKVASAS
jgi:hypothetical protein